MFAFPATRPIFFLQSSRNRVDLLSYESKMIDKQEQYYRRGEKNLDGHAQTVFSKINVTTSSVCLFFFRNMQPNLEGERKIKYSPKFCLAIQSYCFHFSVGLLSYNSRSSLIRMDRRKKDLDG